MTFPMFRKKIPTEEAAIEYFFNIRYGGILSCPHCGATNKVYRYRNRKKVCRCKSCDNTFSIFKNTIFEKSTTDFDKWLFAIHLFLRSRKGLSALFLSGEIEVTYKTAWSMLQKIRIAMQNDEFTPFEGLVEMDETYLGGRPRKYPPKPYNPATYDELKKLTTGRGTTKATVAGIIERNSGRVYSQIMPADESGKKVSGTQLYEVIDKICIPGTVVITDDFSSYDILDKPFSPKVDLSLLDDGDTPSHSSHIPRFGHYTVRHKHYEWVAGVTIDGELIHTNSIESHWAIVKRSHYGVYHFISVKYLPRYLSEFCFRQSTRKMSPIDVFDLLLKQSVLKPMPEKAI